MYHHQHFLCTCFLGHPSLQIYSATHCEGIGDMNQTHANHLSRHIVPLDVYGDLKRIMFKSAKFNISVSVC